jgi:K+-sensing histidine kinase KdpD
VTEAGHQSQIPDPASSAPPSASHPHRSAEKPNRAAQLLRVTSAIAEAVSSDAVYAALVDHVSEATQASSVALWLLDNQHRVARLVRARGYQDTAIAKLEHLHLDTMPTVPALECIRHADPVWIRSQRDMLARYPHLREYATPGRDYRVSALPLVSRARVLGALALTIENDVPGDAEEQEFLRLVARYASQAVERLRLLEAETRSRKAADAAAERLKVLNRASRLFAEIGVDVMSHLKHIAQQLSQALGGCVNIALLEPDGSLRVAASHHPDPDANAQLEPLANSAPIQSGEGISGRIAATGRSVFLPRLEPSDLSKAPAAYRDFLARYPAYALIGTALTVRDRVIGMVTATRVNPGETYDAADLQLLEELADRAAVAIDNCRLFQEVSEARTRAEDTVKQNELFAGVLAHDLRTPLYSIVSTAETELDAGKGESSATANSLERILRSGKRMATMIGQLVDFTRARSGHGIEIAPRDADLADVCHNAIAELESSHPDWLIEFATTGNSAGHWDPDCLCQMMSNLISNAGEHGKRPAPVRVELDGSQAAQVRVTVNNDGAIDPELMPFLFDPFRRGHDPATHSNGLGLGLYIVREIVHAHGGTIAVDSSDTGGTRVDVTLPRVSNVRPPADRTDQPRSISSSARPIPARTPLS